MGCTRDQYHERSANRTRRVSARQSWAVSVSRRRSRHRPQLRALRLALRVSRTCPSVTADTKAELARASIRVVVLVIHITEQRRWHSRKCIPKQSTKRQGRARAKSPSVDHLRIRACQQVHMLQLTLTATSPEQDRGSIGTRENKTQS